MKKTTYDIYVKDHPGGVFNGRQIAPYRQEKLRINYHTTCGKTVREWRTLHQLKSWWKRRTNADFPIDIEDSFYELDNFDEIYEADESVYLLPTIAIRVKTTMGKWPEIVDSMVADVPARV